MMTRRLKRRKVDVFKGNAYVGSVNSVDALNLCGKLSALKASSSVVALQSFIGEDELFICSGFIIESRTVESNGKQRFVNHVVTAASLFACSSSVSSLSSNIRNFTGGPLVNCNGEVIGVNFYHHGDTSFLPTNIVLRCLESLKKQEHVHRPWHGIELADLYTADVGILEKIIRKFPDISGGVIVEKVKEDSPADRAGLVSTDVIFQCNGSTIRCSLEFFGMMWEKAGESVELLVKRVNGDSLRLTMVVEEAKHDSYNRWPIPNLWDLPPSDITRDFEISQAVEKFDGRSEWCTNYDGCGRLVLHEVVFDHNIILFVTL